MNQNATSKQRPCADTDDESTCPTCNAPIAGVSTTGPSKHHLEPCGHEIGPMTARHFAEGARRAITDGGTDQIEVCPACDSSQIHPNVGGINVPDGGPEYHCGRCGHRFDEPAHREQRPGGGLPGDSYASALDRANPDDLVTDGGIDQCDCDICGRTRADVERADLALFDEPVSACQFCRRTYRTDDDACLNCGGPHDGNHIAIDGPSGEADREADVDGYLCDDCCHDLIDRIVAGGSAADAVDTDADDEAVATDGGERQ